MKRRSNRSGYGILPTLGVGILLLLVSMQASAQAYRQARLKAAPPTVSTETRPVMDTTGLSFMNKARIGMQTRPHRAVFSFTNSLLLRVNPSLDLGVTSGVEFYNILGSNSTITQVPIMFTAHIYISNTSYFLAEPAYFMPVSASYLDVRNNQVDYPKEHHQNTLGCGLGYGHWLTNQLTFEVYMRSNKCGLEGMDGNTPMFVGVNFAYFLH